MNPLARLATMVAAVPGTAPRPDVLFSLGPLHVTTSLVSRATLAIVTILAALFLLRLVPLLEKIVMRFAGRSTTSRSASATAIDAQQRVETLTRVTSSFTRTTIWTLTVIIVAGHVGINIGPLLAGAGIAGVAIGFGAQSIVKDLFAGFFILLENQFAVGDTVTIGGITGTVEEMTLRVTLVRDERGTAHFIPNSSITIVANRTQGRGRAMVELLFAWTIPEADVRATLSAIIDRMARAADFPTVFPRGVSLDGPTEISQGAFQWRLIGETVAQVASEARRDMIGAVAVELSTRGYVSQGNIIARPATP